MREMREVILTIRRDGMSILGRGKVLVSELEKYTSECDAVSNLTVTVTGAHVRVTSQDENPLFNANDVCDALGFRDTNDGTKHLDDEEKQVVRITSHSMRGNPNQTIINESGLFSLILKSRKPEAKAFKKWVTRDVLPAIRKDGMYIMGKEKVATGEMSGEELMSRAIIFENIKIERMAEEMAQLERMEAYVPRKRREALRLQP
jgi:prophage antirepressor-like protein